MEVAMVTKPATVLEIEMYSDDQIAAWDAEDRLSPDERSAIRIAPFFRPPQPAGPRIF